MATRRSKILSCHHAFHGLTYGALSLVGDEMFRQGFEPFLGECETVPFNDLVALDRALSRRDVAAFVFEPIQGKGVNLPADGYLAEAEQLCRKHGTLFVADEIQCGMGRTGRFLACEHYGVEPDLVLLAKALSGGFVPVGAVACRSSVFNKVFDRMDKAVVHGSTFAKNDLAMAAGLATLAVFDEEHLIERAADFGERLIEGLRRRIGGSEFVRDVRGKGLMLAIEFGAPASLKLRTAYGLMERANRGLFCQLILLPLFKRHRILAQVAGHNLPVIKLLPAYVIDEADLAWIENAFAEILEDSQSLGSFWDAGRMLATQAMKAKAGAA
jgi:ornithine--oxo-acid transaminase